LSRGSWAADSVDGLIRPAATVSRPPMTGGLPRSVVRASWAIRLLEPRRHGRCSPPPMLKAGDARASPKSRAAWSPIQKAASRSMCVTAKLICRRVGTDRGPDEDNSTPALLF
jgi:hypothetical protein